MGRGRSPLTAAAVAAALVLTAGCGGDPPPQPVALSGPAAAGRTVFTETSTPACVTCHSTDDTGGSRRHLADLHLTDDELAGWIRSGGNGMPAYATTLEDEEIAALVAYLDAVARRPRP